MNIKSPSTVSWVHIDISRLLAPWSLPLDLVDSEETQTRKGDVISLGAASILLQGPGSFIFLERQSFLPVSLILLLRWLFAFPAFIYLLPFNYPVQTVVLYSTSLYRSAISTSATTTTVGTGRRCRPDAVHIFSCVSWHYCVNNIPQKLKYIPSFPAISKSDPMPHSNLASGVRCGMLFFLWYKSLFHP